MARAWAELLTPRPFDLTTFPNDEGYDELVVARDIPVRSVCEHHLLPFTGRAWVAYLPGDRILGLSRPRRGCPSRWPTGCRRGGSRRPSVLSSPPSTPA